MPDLDRRIEITRSDVFPGTWQGSDETEPAARDFGDSIALVLAGNADRTGFEVFTADDGPPWVVPNAVLLMPFFKPEGLTVRVEDGTAVYEDGVIGGRGVTHDGYHFRIRAQIYAGIGLAGDVFRFTAGNETFIFSPLSGTADYADATTVQERSVLEPLVNPQAGGFRPCVIGKVQDFALPFQPQPGAKYGMTFSGYYGVMWAARISLSFGTRYRSPTFLPGDTAIYRVRSGAGGIMGDPTLIKGSVLADPAVPGRPEYSIEGTNIVGRGRYVELLCHRV